MMAFKKMKNIDTAFRYVRSFTILVIAACVLISSLVVYKSFSLISGLENKIYILSNGKVLDAYASNRKDNIPVEARDHIKTFHEYFFTLDPDDKVIQTNITKALYLADGSAKRAYDNLKESGYYTGVISGNISQRIQVDSVTVDTREYPYHFECYATEQIIRATSTVYRNLITEGLLRSVSRSDHNPHGFLIEHWNTTQNKDIKTTTTR